ncbi:hypothetical protein DPMN_069740 [Dreissena polymorpha]|uniref:Uncharacterized protein n=1 Tax=Dreissena polymorpha TaxID=45954 RepID=A0A9D4BNC1_DREPO|nr:hypothetical protein DPMN_069740 [Dreissena polymorpha]
MHRQQVAMTNIQTKFHDDLKIIVATRVLSRKNAPPPLAAMFFNQLASFSKSSNIIGMNLLTKRNAPALGSYFHKDRQIDVASRVLTRFYYSHIRKKCPAPWRPYIIGMDRLTKFHEDQTINVASRVKNPPPLGSHVFQAKVTIYELLRDIIETNLLTKFHEDWTINVASKELTRQMLTAHNTRRTKGDHKSSL